MYDTREPERSRVASQYSKTQMVSNILSYNTIGQTMYL